MSGVKRSVGKKALLFLVLASSAAWAATYLAGTSPSSAGMQFGLMQFGAAAHPSVPGVRTDGGVNAWAFDATGNVLDGSGDLGRVFMYDALAAADLTDGVANRGDQNFAMMIWDFGRPVDFVRVYPMVDHGTPGGPFVDEFHGGDMISQSLWGSNDGDSFVLLSDATAFATGGVNGQTPTWTFTGVQPTVYRGGSAEFGAINGYTRDYTLPNSYRYFGIRASTIRQVLKFDFSDNAIQDSDPEIDAIATNPPEEEGCTYTQGYWKNHPAAWPALPPGGLLLGTVGYTKAQLICILKTPVKGNGLVSLAHQLITAKLNDLNGASVPAGVQTAINNADTLIGSKVVPKIGAGYLHPSSTSSLTGALDAYNNGVAPNGPPHCD
jgi:hypothetical protein